MKFFALALLLSTGATFAADLREYSCTPNALYESENTDLGVITLKGDIEKNEVNSIQELDIAGEKKVIKMGASSNSYFYAMEGRTRKLAFEISYEHVNEELSFDNELRLYVYGKSSWSQHADPVPAFQIATYYCKRI